MKNFINYISVGLICLITFSCSNDLLWEDPYHPENFSSAEIFISQNWEAKNYPVYIPGAGDANFSVLSAPYWLNTQDWVGKFTNDLASLNFSVFPQSNFYEMGIYKSFLTLNIEGIGKAKIPVSYVSEGNPTIKTETNLTLPYDYFSNTPLVIKNEGNGILLYSIGEKPVWIKINELKTIPYSLDSHVFMIPPNGETVLNLSLNTDSPLSEGLSGNIKILSNDNGNPSSTITVTAGYISVE